ncbi:hypothetical protein P7K49_033756 [Saguinus oedipus]|uniref:DNA-directed RNA polymerase n=1 Tax=Saguinus oedipus TaxID=9490 RepID=A0ABQ9TTB6_SAGOE|nr:hypothetical protein P7K49_033756 [Saguinus oedipus]
MHPEPGIHPQSRDQNPRSSPVHHSLQQRDSQPPTSDRARACSSAPARTPEAAPKPARCRQAPLAGGFSWARLECLRYRLALGAPEPPQEQPWPLPVQVELSHADAVQLPVLYHLYFFRNVYQIGFQMPHPAYLQLLATAAEPTVTFEAVDVPMLCPPLPRTSLHTGAFLLSPTNLMRSVDCTMHHQRLLENSPPTALHGALDTLTQLGNWLPQAPRAGPAVRGGPTARGPPAAQLARCLKEAGEVHSLWADALYRLSLAQNLRNCVFWLPHNMDFRGRTYPCPPHFSHLARALLEFAQGRPLSPLGLDWLKSHVVNLTGLKKRELLQVLQAFADGVMSDILDSADRPVTGRRWWMGSEEPWQTLACRMEIAKAVRTSDPAAYVSHLPVHQDGSCNGLQHCTTLGRDSVGAASVNLEPSDVPQDVDSDVAAQVEVFRRQDDRHDSWVAQVLEGIVTRKVVKQTVMTVVYGVTRFGWRLQIEKNLRELSDFPQEFLWEASH